MKKAQFDEIVIWDCPYKSCEAENYEYGLVSEGSVVQCSKCRREVKLSSD